MAIYAIEMTKLEVNGNLVTLQPGSSQLFSENDFTMKYEVEQSSMNSSSFIVFHYYLEEGMEMLCSILKSKCFNCIAFSLKMFLSNQ